MAEAFIVAAARTAGGRRKGRLAGVHPADLAAHVLDAVVARAGIDPAEVEDVVMGCVGQIGEQSFNVARQAVLTSVLPQGTPATTVDRQCGSSQQALHFAAATVMAGQMDGVIAAGVESMTRVPMMTNYSVAAKAGMGGPYSDALKLRYPGEDFSQFASAERIAREHGLDRATLDAFALASHRKAAAATERGDFADEIVAIEVVTAAGIETHRVDEGIRTDASLEAIGGVDPIVPGGLVSAASASQLCDGASAVLIASGAAVARLGLTPLARIHTMTVTAGDPENMLEEPLFATDKALKRAGMTIDQIDLYEVNEAFAPVPLAWAKHVGADLDKLNVNGGAIALGHPLGASGTKLMTTLVHALRRRRLRWGLQTMCEGGGQANVTIVEAL
ncbi:acetyl-CoA C-acetyltransferase [uncultured Sphingomonas sp.]|uniref:acetyl-CoA C-acetyltransferase n=1 Tax=uncultured Sphingomonas sp. TaxID=158754 RepID=UPI0035C97A4A